MGNQIVHLDPETMTKVAMWRAKSESGQMTIDEYKQAILDLRGARMNALASQSKSKAGKGGSRKASTPVRSADDMLNELDGV